MALIEPFKGVSPRIHENSWVAENAVVIGDVDIGECSTIWYGAVVRGDVNHIRIGRYSNIQDGAVVHVNGTPSHPTILGDYVTVGHCVCLHGCTLEDECLIGIGASVLNGAVVESHSIVAAGALVREGQVVRSGTLVAGVPAKEVRKLSEKELEKFKKQATHYWEGIASPYLPSS